MSADALPIGIHQFSEAIKDLPLTTLHLKAAELRNSIAHLDYSNEQLKPFAEPPSPSTEQPDPVCVEAIQENKDVVRRMSERLDALRREVEGRGASWMEFLTAEEVVRALGEGRGDLVEGGATAAVNGISGGGDPWSDGTFSTGRISGGEVIMDSPAAAAAAAAPTTRTNPQVDGDGVNGVVTSGTSQPTSQNGFIEDEELRRRMEERLMESMADDEDGMHL